jgi:cystathionine beta-lyase/cystathionine gamma-synthase
VEIKATIQQVETDTEAKIEKEKIQAMLCEKLGSPINPILTKTEIKNIRKLIAKRFYYC